MDPQARFAPPRRSSRRRWGCNTSSSLGTWSCWPSARRALRTPPSGTPEGCAEIRRTPPSGLRLLRPLFVSCACAMCPIRPVPGSPTCPASSHMRSSGPPTAEPHRESRRPTAQEYDFTPRAENRTCLGLARRLPRLCVAGARDVGALRRRQRACGLHSPVTEEFCGTVYRSSCVGQSRSLATQSRSQYVHHFCDRSQTLSGHISVTRIDAACSRFTRGLRDFK